MSSSDDPVAQFPILVDECIDQRTQLPYHLTREMLTDGWRFRLQMEGGVSFYWVALMHVLATRSPPALAERVAKRLLYPLITQLLHA